MAFEEAVLFSKKVVSTLRVVFVSGNLPRESELPIRVAMDVVLELFADTTVDASGEVETAVVLGTFAVFVPALVVVLTFALVARVDRACRPSTWPYFPGDAQNTTSIARMLRKRTDHIISLMCNDGTDRLRLMIESIREVWTMENWLDCGEKESQGKTYHRMLSDSRHHIFEGIPVSLSRSPTSADRPESSHFWLATNTTAL